MPRVIFTRNLQRFFPGLSELDIAGTTVAEIVRSLDAHHPGLADYLIDERGALRKHVNIFVDNTLVSDRAGLSDPVPPGCSVHVIQALSGG